MNINLKISIYILIIFLLTIYAFLKEREELGCYRVSIEQQCDDQNSVYIKGTKMKENDTKEILIDRLKSTLNYHEKGGVWKRCLIFANIIILFTLLLNQNNTSEFFISLHLSIFTITYFFFNYINYHHFRHLKKNGYEIIDKLYTI